MDDYGGMSENQFVDKGLSALRQERGKIIVWGFNNRLVVEGRRAKALRYKKRATEHLSVLEEGCSALCFFVMGVHPRGLGCDRRFRAIPFLLLTIP
jgi:hypothetical protein